MKMTIELPTPLVQQFRARVPSHERSQFVANLLAKKLQGTAGDMEEAARKANTLRQVSRDMKDWEALTAVNS